MVATRHRNRIGAHFDTMPAGLPELPPWGVSANAIPKDGFTEYLRGHGIGVEPAQAAA